jgi:hypothetical protein
MIVSYGILFMPPVVVVDIFVRTSMQSISVRTLEPRGCKLNVVAIASSFLECRIEH